MKLSLFSVITLFTALIFCSENGIAQPFPKGMLPGEKTEQEFMVKGGITFSKTAHDYGAVAFQQERMAIFPFTNSGTTPIIIREVHKSSGWLAITWPEKSIQPGQAEYLEVLFLAGERGHFAAELGVIFHPENNLEPIKLEVSAEVK